MRKISPALPLVLLAVFLPVFAHAQIGDSGGQRKSLSGNAYYADNGNPAARALVEVRDSQGLVVASEMTTDSGAFSFGGLLRGVYELTMNIVGYEPVRQIADLSFASSHGNVLNLVKRDAVNSEPAFGSAVSAHVLSMPEKARDAFEVGKKKLHQDKDAQAGLLKFQEAIAAAPKFYEAYEQMAIAYLTLGKTKNAEGAVRKSIELSGDKYPAADVDLAALLLDKSELAEGEKVVRHALELDPTYWLGHYELGRALFLEHRVADAQKSAEECRALRPNFPMVYRLLSNIHISQHDNVALLQDLNEYIKLDPYSPAGIRAKEMRDRLQRTVKTSPTTAPKR